MTTVAFRGAETGADAGAHALADDRPPRLGGGLLDWVTTTDHKKIGILYLSTSFVFFLVGGLLASLMRLELAEPGLQFLSKHGYNEAFTMHGTVMMFLFAVPAAAGLANYFVPLQVGAPDMAFPRLNALSYWLYLGGGLVMLSGFLTAHGAADFGWTAYAPLSSAIYSSGAGPDLWILGLLLTGTASILGAVNIITTILGLRAPGMTMLRIPIFTWNMLATNLLVLFAFPVITGALCMLFADRRLGTHFFEPAGGGVPLLWQHLFWFFGHPEVYIVVLPFFGVVTDVIAVFSGRRVFGYKAFVLATMAITAYSVTTWAHHMFATGLVLSPFFSGMTFLIAVPTGVKFFSWLATMWGGRIRLRTPMLYAIGFMVIFLIGGLTGPMLASPAFDLDVTDTYFIVAHMHYVLTGSAIMALFAGIFYWFPKMTGRMLSERLGKIQFWALLVGLNVTFFPQHLLGLQGMPRRFANYRASDGWTTLNLVSSLGHTLTTVGIVVFMANVWLSWRHGAPAGDDPWEAHTLEWATTSPPPPHNFHALPPIRSERPTWDLRHGGAEAAQEQEG